MATQCILVPVEYSEHCRRALELAGELAAELGARVEVVHAWDHPKLVPDDLTVHTASGEPRSLFELMGENAEREMTEFLAACPMPAGVGLSHHLLNGEPCAAILAAVERLKPDLVVVATHGRSGLRHFLMGSIAEKLVQLSPVPVLCVPAKHGPAEP
jgi:universal stress protein A